MQLYNEDCLTGLSKIKDNQCDMAFLDLPYGITEHEWDKKLDLNALWKQLHRVVKDNGPIIATATGFFTIDLINSNHENYKYSLVWIKNRPTGFALSNKRPLRAHEDVLVFYKEQPFYNKQGVELEKPYSRRLPGKSDKISKTNVINSTGLDKEGNPLIGHYTHKCKTTVMQFSNDNRHNFGNGTSKPVDLIKYLIETYSKEGNIILDPTFGSGSCAIAAFETNRKFIGFEKDLEQYNFALNRINKETF